MNFPNEKGVGVVHPLMEKPEKRSGGVQDSVPFSFSFEGSDMRVEGEEEEEGCYRDQNEQGVCQNNPSKERE